MPDPLPPTTEHLSTPLAWADAGGRLLGCNPAFASWLGVSARRLVGLDLGELDAEGGRLLELLPRLPPSGEAVRVRRARLAFPGAVNVLPTCGWRATKTAACGWKRIWPKSSPAKIPPPRCPRPCPPR